MKHTRFQIELPSGERVAAKHQLSLSVVLVQAQSLADKDTHDSTYVVWEYEDRVAKVSRLHDQKCVVTEVPR